jgi:hypothetical protein
MAKPRDVVLVVGKGHQDFQEYWDGISPPNQPETLKVGGPLRGWCSAGGIARARGVGDEPAFLSMSKL